MLLVHLLLLLLSLRSVWTRGQPHIIFILADDMGWNDVSFHGSDQIPTPNIDALAFNGVILNQHYVQPLCTPTRAALMTGRYPIHTGMQGLPMFGAEPRGLPLSVRILPQYLKELGYTTRLVGKWHLGYFRREYTPTYRGFDSHLGYWTGSISYYDHVLQDAYPDGTILNGHDFRRNLTSDWDDDGKYATDVFTDEAVRLIREHGTTAGDSRPLFLLVSHLAAHAGNAGKLVEAPQETVNKFRYISDPNRRTYAAMISKMDDSVGRIVETLDEQHMLKNSIIVFLSDNGAPTIGVFQNWGSNYPLKGIKATLWEGGIRGAALIWSPLLQQTPRVSNQLMHVTDWLPTLYAIAGGNPTVLDRNVDGVNMWDALSYALESPRQQVLLNIDEAHEVAAIRVRNWKLILGTWQNGTYDAYFGDSGFNLANPPYEFASLFTSPAGKAITHVQRYMTPASEINQLRHQATVRCNMPGQLPVSNCQISGTRNACLFDISSDPCEVNDLASNYPDVARLLYNILVQYRGTLVPQLNRPLDIIGADPRRFNNTWSPWLDSPYA